MKTPKAPTEALSAPLGDLIAAVGRGVAQAQSAMDAQTLETVQQMYGGGDAMLDALRQIGYQPTWYRIPEVESEIVISLSVSGSSEEASSGPPKLYAAPVDATYSNKYEFSLEAASKVRFKIVPVPPSSAAADLKAAPDLTGMTLDQAVEWLDRLAIPWRHASPQTASNEAKITRQQPGPGQLLPRDGTLVLETS